ncbi:protein-L-isoaspartate(D-aspartate) O-methyltransferase [Salinibacterium sp. ZJ450]|uniref:protein-L-isoaspartate(D-aspartate) O-methyltransferase n=1 Tax=Salinibacterium sp. ZJ450 TaxID=2708338 RepID=UPI00141EDD4C|nr:protein-L-isoaspartate(D-aspartate) O-methyltransferase [Salinibacterium sp. ZJ450]
MRDFDRARERMVDEQIARRGVRDDRVLAAMRRVPRHEFVSVAQEDQAYADYPLHIAEKQTISQPYIVARMCEAARIQSGDRVLEIGTGSGYGAAVLAELAAEVFTIERHDSLADAARLRLRNYPNVRVRSGDGTLGWPEQQPFDAIVVTAAGPAVPQPLTEQLTIGGRLVIPVDVRNRGQQLIRVTRTADDEYTEETLLPVVFVPLIGEWGRPER